ncbi:hypothetical protein, partial [Flavobacterium granuli]
MGDFSSKSHKFFRPLFLIILFFVTSVSKAQFPFAESFKNKTAPSVQFSGEALLTAGPIDPDGSGFLRLTSNANQKKGAVWSDVTSFPSYYGIDMSFEYYTYGNTSTNGADGIGFILYDAKTINPTIGPPGGNLGYTENKPKPNSDGFTTGYLGIGIDEFGNFSYIGGGTPDKKPNSITLRGSYLDGYPYLTSVQTTALTPSFNIAGGSRTATTLGSTGYRKIRIILKPAVSNTGYIVNVYLTHEATTVHIITDYAYTTPAPENLKFAFSSSTGNSNNYHEIRSLNFDVSATLSNPVAASDTLGGCAGLTTEPVDIHKNDDGAVNISGAVNKASVDLDPSNSGIQFTKTVAEGTFTYKPTTGTVTFTPIDNTIEGPVTIDYTFADTYGKISNVATISYETVQKPIVNTITAPATTSFCASGDATNIIGGDPTGGNDVDYFYQWQSSTDNITFTDIDDDDDDAKKIDYDPGSINTTTYYRRVVTSGDCSTPSNVVTITIDKISNTTSTAAICENTTKALTATPTGGRWDLLTVGGTILGNIYTPADVEVNTPVTIQYTVSAGSCGSIQSDVTFNVDPFSGTASNTTSTSAICETTTKTLVATPAGGTWSIVSGGGSISGTIYTPANVNANTAVKIRYTVPANASCGSTQSDVTFNVDPFSGTASNTTSTSAICETTTKTLVATPAGGTWSIVSGGGSISGSIYTPADINADTTVKIRYTVAANGSCGSTQSDVTFTVNPFSGTANNTTATTPICETDTKALTASPVGGTWSIISGGGSISATAPYIYTPDNISADTNVAIRYTVAANGSCGSTQSDVTFTVNPFSGTANNTTATTPICETDTKALTASPVGGTWSIISGGGSISATAPYIYTPDNISADTNVAIRYTVAANGSCGSTQADVTFTVNPFSGTANNTTATTPICETDTKALTASPAGGTWSIISGGGSISATAPYIYTPDNISADTNVTIRYTVVANGSCGSTQADVTFTVNPFSGTANNTTATTPICETDTKALTASPVGGTWSIISGGGSISATAPYIYTPDNISADTN